MGHPHLSTEKKLQKHGWATRRFELTGTMPNGMTAMTLGVGNPSTFPAGQTIYVWGAQIVTGSSPGAPIETTNTTTSDVNGSTVNLAANGLNESYSYDGFGNMLQAGNFNFVQAYTTANQLSGWSYDASGNLLIDGQNNGYAYDAEGRISAEGTYVGSNGSYTFNPAYNYVYDAEGNRVAKTGGAVTDYIYFGGRELARLAGGQWTDMIYGPTGLLAEVQGTQTSAPVYRMVDHLGTAVGTLSSTGTVLSLTDYAPFGQVFAGGSTDPYKFTGKERDQESGNDYFGARYYASSMGRFMSPDWSSSSQAVPYANLENPQSLNLYAYVGNNPLGRVDANGHCWGWIQWLCNGAQSVKNGLFTDYGFHTNATVKKEVANERAWILQGATDQGTIKTVNGWDQDKVHDVYKCMQSESCMKMLADIASAAAQLFPIGSQIANGHSWAKHQGEYPGKSQQDFEKIVDETILHPDDVKQLSRGRTAYWNDAEQTIVIHDPSSPDGGTAFRPTDGKAYFDSPNLK